MKNEKLLDAIGNINDEIINEAANIKLAMVPNIYNSNDILNKLHVTTQKKTTTFFNAKALSISLLVTCCIIFFVSSYFIKNMKNESSTIDVSNSTVREAEKFEGKAKNTMHIFVDQIRVTNIHQLSTYSDLVVKTKFIKKLGVFNMSEILKEKGYPNNGNLAIRTFYQLEVLDVYMGDATIGDIIEVQVEGGIYNNTLLDDDYSEEMTNKFEYILFLFKSSHEDIPYGVFSDIGYLPIKDQRLSLHKKIIGAAFFANNESEEQVISQIKDNVETKEEKEVRLIENELRAVQGAKSPSDSVSAISINEAGDNDNLIKYKTNTIEFSSLQSYIYMNNPEKCLDEKTDEQVFNVSFYGINGNKFLTVTLTNSAYLYKDKWYSYTNKYHLNISEIYKEINDNAKS